MLGAEGPNLYNLPSDLRPRFRFSAVSSILDCPCSRRTGSSLPDPLLFFPLLKRRWLPMDPPSHRRFPRAVHARARRRERIHRHKKRCAGALVFGHRLHGSLGLEPDFSGRQVLVLTAGKFGERWVSLAKAFGCSVETVSAPYGETFALEQIRAQTDARNPLRLCASHRKLHRSAS